MRIVDALADLILGSKCAGCLSPGLGLCLNCKQAIAHTFSRQLPNGLQVISCAEYSGPAARLVTAFKDEGCWSLAKPIAEAMNHALMNSEEAVYSPQLLIVGVPSAPKALRTRGFNHTAALARALAKHQAGWSSQPLLRAKAGRDQAALERAERWANRESSFVARPGTGVVMLIDDLVTTGATLVGAAQTLIAAGWTISGAITLASAPLRFGDAPGIQRQSHDP